MRTKVTAVFDIGKTNKKFFLFDSNFLEVYREYTSFDEIVDEDGFPTENLEALEEWAKEVFDRMLDSDLFEIKALNFSCYGASMVHIDENGNPLMPLVNYLKPISDEVSNAFYDSYGPENELSRITGSPKLAMLNSGMQLFWLKKKKSEVFKKIKYSLHLPQYMSYLFTGVAVSDYTSIGCHTRLWDYEKNDYHSWVYNEGIIEKLAPIVSTKKTIPVGFKGKTIQIGVGIHDSSSALVPYMRSIKESFLLISTGTWSISINPFNAGMLTLQDIEQKSLFNMRIDGKPVKISRLFLGKEYDFQVKLLSKLFNVSDDYHKSVKFNEETLFKINQSFEYMFCWVNVSSEKMPKKTRIIHETFEFAYHQLMIELVFLQVKSTESVLENEVIERLYVNGGFSQNEVYIQLMTKYVSTMKLNAKVSSIGSALGASLVISNTTLAPNFLEKNYAQ